MTTKAATMPIMVFIDGCSFHNIHSYNFIMSCSEKNIYLVWPIGFEKDRKHGTLRKLCPAKQYDIECKYRINVR